MQTQVVLISFSLEYRISVCFLFRKITQIVFLNKIQKKQQQKMKQKLSDSYRLFIFVANNIVYIFTWGLV